MSGRRLTKGRLAGTTLNASCTRHGPRRKCRKVRKGGTSLRMRRMEIAYWVACRGFSSTPAGHRLLSIHSLFFTAHSVQFAPLEGSPPDAQVPKRLFHNALTLSVFFQPPCCSHEARTVFFLRRYRACHGGGAPPGPASTSTLKQPSSSLHRGTAYFRVKLRNRQSWETLICPCLCILLFCSCPETEKRRDDKGGRQE